MDYRKMGDTYYIRMDRGDEIITRLCEVCEKSGILSATFSGIGGCSEAETQTFDPGKGCFGTKKAEGMLEMVSLSGNLVKGEDGHYSSHAHALFSLEKDGKTKITAGHLKSAVVLYTAEIELRPVQGGTLKKRPDPETGTGFWSFE